MKIIPAPTPVPTMLGRILIALAVLVPVLVLVAAPVPKARPITALAYSAEDLAKLPFVSADEIPKDHPKRRVGPKAKQVALAVTLPKSTYEFGEPIEALFALKNRTDKPLEFGYLFDFPNEKPNTWNEARIEILDTKSGKLAGCGGSHTWASVNGGPEMPANGYYVTRGNVAWTGMNERLPVGEYQLCWKYGWATSNTVSFRVLDRVHRAAKTFKGIRVLQVTEQDLDGELKQILEIDESRALQLTWDAAGLLDVDLMSASLSLGTGQFGDYYPSLRLLPEANKSLRASVKWQQRGDETSFTATLSVTEKDLKVQLGDKPFVYLLLECDSEDDRFAQQALQEQVLASSRRILDARNPFELTVKLPAKWTERLNAPGPARVAVLLTSEEFERGGERQNRQKELRSDSDPERAKFALRTPWREITLAKPTERSRDREK